MCVSCMNRHKNDKNLNFSWLFIRVKNWKNKNNNEEIINGLESVSYSVRGASSSIIPHFWNDKTFNISFYDDDDDCVTDAQFLL